MSVTGVWRDHAIDVSKISAPDPRRYFDNATSLQVTCFVLTWLQLLSIGLIKKHQWRHRKVEAVMLTDYTRSIDHSLFGARQRSTYITYDKRHKLRGSVLLTRKDMRNS